LNWLAIFNIVSDPKRGKATDVDRITAEQQQFSHPVLSVMLEKIFDLMILCTWCVPGGFRYSYCDDNET